MGFSPCGRRGIPPRRESCSVRYPWPVLCCTVARVFAPACAVAAAGGHPPNFRYSLHLVIRPREKKGGTGALSTCIIPKCAPLVKKKEGRTAVLPPSYAPARRDIQGPRFPPAAPKVGLSGKCPAGASLMPGCAGWRPAPPPPAPDGSGSGPEWPPPAYGGLRG